MFIGFTSPWTFPSPEDEEESVAPKPPKRTLSNDLFIALHINTVNIVPAAPTKIPPSNITIFPTIDWSIVVVIDPESTLITVGAKDLSKRND